MPMGSARRSGPALSAGPNLGSSLIKERLSARPNTREPLLLTLNATYAASKLAKLFEEDEACRAPECRQTPFPHSNAGFHQTSKTLRFKRTKPSARPNARGLRSLVSDPGGPESKLKNSVFAKRGPLRARNVRGPRLAIGQSRSPIQTQSAKTSSAPSAATPAGSGIRLRGPSRL